MSTSKPMSDGGKGSVRRNEDTEAYRNNFENIFGKKDKTPMNEHIDDEYDEDEDHICPACNGSGEGMYDGSTCYKCGGTGEWMNDRDDDIGECYDIDD